MFRVGLNGEDGKIKWQSQIMDVKKLIESYPTAKFDISPDEVSEFCKKMALPPGKDDTEYIRVRIIFYQDNKSSKPFAYIFPIYGFGKHTLDEKKSTLPVSLNNIMPERAPAPAISNRNYIQRRHLLSIDRPPKAPAA
ncbi:uncharacterized protein LOC132935620 [Metopolophium dirhodum]|uniref:uncharacterized protein LOC132935620 n=1 Tax=Metopolophium dirhodum TaxID=44670 RepID=UPI00298F44A8|nr:uncharacterized protein LOC132935620 [Metopolophium dirhodum]